MGIKVILEIIRDFIKSLPILNRWFTKTPSEKIDDKQQDAHKTHEDFKKSGRPKW